MISVMHGDCREVLATLEADRFDAVVTDPPYHLTSIVKRFGSPTAAPAKFGTDGAYARASAGFMGKTWDGGGVAFDPDTWRAVWRVLKPGGHMLAFSGTRTQHRMVCAIEDAGFEIRDTLCWLYGQGFSKSRNVAINIDKAAGALGHRGKGFNTAGQGIGLNAHKELRSDHPDYVSLTYATPEAAQWSGWGTALKPAVEMICLARKPLSERTIAANVLRWSTGSLNIDACRVATNDGYTENCVTQGINTAQTSYEPRRERRTFEPATAGRWPANVCHDGSPEVLAAFAAAGERSSGTRSGEYANGTFSSGTVTRNLDGSAGSAARFFYQAKADAADRADSRHPTVKPVDLLRWLVRLITPPGGHVLDPFAGSGTTCEACMLEGFDATLIEQDATHVADIHHRMKRWHGGDLPLFTEVAS